MILAQYLDKEIELATKIFLFYTEKAVDYQSVNSLKYQQWYIDSLQIHLLLELLKDVNLNEGNWLGYQEITDRYLVNIFYKIREYWLSEIDSDYSFTDLSDIVIPTNITYKPFAGDWKEVTVTISANNTTVIPLPFNYDNIDPESLIVSIVGAMDPVNEAPDDEPGFRIIENSLHWNTGNYYNLDTGDKVFMKYLQIKA